MIKKDIPETELSAFRKQIDDLDDKLIALLKERIRRSQPRRRI